MRKILFRGKRIDNGELVEGYYSPVNLPLVGNVGHYINEGGYRAIEVDPNTVGQFTGLLDKNSKEIFEGDILKSTMANYITLVDFKGVSFVMKSVVKSNCKVLKMPRYDFEELKLTDGIYEIIGNIHDNANLLGGLTNEFR